MPSSPNTKISTIVNYAEEVRNSAPRLSLMTLVLHLVASVFEGVGYILLLPILGFLGLNSANSEDLSKSINGTIDPVLNELSATLSLGVLLLVFLGVLAFRAMLTYFAASSSAALKGKFLHHHRASLHEAIITAPWAFLSTQSRSSLTHALTTQSNILVNGIDTLYRGSATVFSMGVAVIIAAILSWKITLGVLALSLFIIWPLKVFNRRAFLLGNEAHKNMIALFEHSIPYFKGMKTIKAASAEEDVLSFFESKSLNQSKVFSSLERNHAKASLAYQMVSAVFLVGFVYLALTYFPDQKTQTIVLIIIFARLAPRANTLQSYSNNLVAIMPEYIVAKELRNVATKARESEGLLQPSPIIKQGLDLTNIGFCFTAANETTAILKNITLKLPVRSSTAIVGASGAGKTTLADIIAGLLSPNAGVIKIDGRVLSQAERRGLAQSIHYITDEDFLFDDSIRRNLSLGHKDVLDDGIWSALKRANANVFVSALPQGLETQIGDSGTKLSHGQRQRLSLVRGLLGNPQILILDEPTSALSQQDVKQIVDTLQTLSREVIVIIITHDEPTFQWVDQIIRIDKGRLTKLIK